MFWFSFPTQPSIYLSSMRIIVSLHPFLLRTRSPQVIVCRQSGHLPLIGTYWPHSRNSLAKQVKWHIRRQPELRQAVFVVSSSLKMLKQISQNSVVGVHERRACESGCFGFERRIMCPRRIVIWAGGGFAGWNGSLNIKITETNWSWPSKSIYRKISFKFWVQPSNSQRQSIPWTAS